MTVPPYKITILKLAIGVAILTLLVVGVLLFGKKKDIKSVPALDANPYPLLDSPSNNPDSMSVDSDANISSNCAGGSDCSDGDDRDNQSPADTGVSDPATSSEVGSQADFAIEEEGIPAVDEKTSKTN